ncbi:Panacea domain-containing protein [Rheinheimera salexigens]|uniref:Antitoxin SocA-like Panacea domain-containing protein n=1 Tax=Rheinheimera salexigens TaxID=1628148 RepID=A0A1E7Q8A2_9GAMM|nr:type II toxin-antitoxin system antitoxin SocA domain-containing protein [Rheinheimera salexigens]OEY70321.1 hypothetical protein BI198_12640 [Rheinheimera salexigens]
MVSNIEVAKAILYYSGTNGKPLSKLALMKLVYYCQGYYLGAFNKPMFQEPICAWKLGPVCPNLYQEYPTGDAYIAPPPNDTFFSELSLSVIDVVKFVVDKFTDITPYQLVAKTHTESPWLNHVNPTDNKWDNKEITHDELQAFFQDEIKNMYDQQFAKILDRVDQQAKTIELPATVKGKDAFKAWIFEQAQVL